jgi:hypothetical protein
MCVLKQLLLSNTQADHDKARDMIAGLITGNHGEYVFRIGAHPPRAKLFSGGLLDDSVPWIGTSRPPQEIDTLRDAVVRTVEEVGGKVHSILQQLFDIILIPEPGLGLV